MVLCIEQTINTSYIIPIITLIGIIVTFAMSLFNYWLNKRKDLEEQLYDVKLKAYKDISNTAFSLIEYLKIQGYPFPDRDNSYHIEEMRDFFKKESLNMGNKIIDCKTVGQNYMVLLPNGSINHYFQFINWCDIYILNGKDFNYNMLTHFKDKCLMDYYKMIDFLRNDLGVDKLDESLKKRLKSL